jgi:hypothetical protein
MDRDALIMRGDNRISMEITMPTKPTEHESWCPERGYEDCTCSLDERIARYEQEHRDPNAIRLPRAVLVSIKSFVRWLWFFITLTLQACGDNAVGSPDAAAIDSQPDAAAVDPCCALLPDENALRACAMSGLPAGTCGVYVCHDSDGGFLTFNVCGPPKLDGGLQ